MTPEELDEYEAWLNRTFRPCTDTWPRVRRLIHALREAEGYPDPKVRVPTLDEFSEGLRAMPGGWCY